MPLMVEVWPAGPNVEKPSDLKAVKLGARAAAEIGADIIKTYYTGSQESFAEVSEGCPIPVVILGGEKGSTEDLFKVIKASLAGGSAGVAMGRNVWGHENPKRMVQAMVAGEIKVARYRWYKSREARIAYLFLLPATIVFIVFTAFPFFHSLYLSFHKWAILTPNKPFVGFGNYQRLFADKYFWNAVQNTLVYSLGTIPGTTICSLGIALLLWKGIKGRNLLRTVYFLPFVHSESRSCCGKGSRGAISSEQSTSFRSSHRSLWLRSSGAESSTPSTGC